MIELKDKRDCCGCGACVQRCPVQCISLVEDREGFLYPAIDLDACTHCDMCDEVCPMINIAEPSEAMKVYAAKSSCDIVRAQSSSGGLFTLLAEQTIKGGGVVIGAQFDKNWEVYHTVAQSIEQVAAMRGSKYLQSRVEQTFAEAEGVLQQGREVLFSGTPCHIAALKLFLGRAYDTLFTVDVACHGVPSPKVWREYLSSVSHGDNITSISFRDKRKGWREYNIAINCGEHSICESQLDNIYLQGFIKGYFLRPSCYACPAKCGRSGSDITLADYWNIRGINARFDDDKGVSLVLVNSDKGLNRFQKLETQSIETPLSHALYKGSALNSSALEPAARSALFEAIDDEPIARLRELLEVPFYTKIIRVVKRHAAKIFKL